MTTEERITHLENIVNMLLKSDRMILDRTLEFQNGRGIQFSTALGGYIGTGITQKLGFYGTAPVVQQSYTGDTTGMTTPGGAAIQENSGLGGGLGTTKYTVHGIVKALKLYGLLKQ